MFIKNKIMFIQLFLYLIGPYLSIIIFDKYGNNSVVEVIIQFSIINYLSIK